MNANFQLVTPRLPLISIVIRAFNEGQHIGRLLTGIEQQTLQDMFQGLGH